MTPEQLLARVFDVDATDLRDATCNFEVAGWDSLGHMTLVVELENAYRVMFSPAETLRMTSVGGIKQVLRERGVAC